MTTLDESTIITQSTPEPSEDGSMRPEAQTWQLGILTDRAGHVHLGAVVAGVAGQPYSYVELLAPIGADSADDLEINELVVLVTGQQLTYLRQIAEDCIDDARLQRQLMQLADLAAV